MKITYSYTPVGQSGRVNRLIAPGDATGEGPIDWRPAAEGALQVAAFPGGAEAETFARGNTVVQRPFTVWRFFRSRGEALRFTLEEELLAGTIGVLKIQNEGGGGGTWTVECGCQRAAVQIDTGVAILMSYLFVGARARFGAINTGAISLGGN